MNAWRKLAMMGMTICGALSIAACGDSPVEPTAVNPSTEVQGELIGLDLLRGNGQVGQHFDRAQLKAQSGAALASLSSPKRNFRELHAQLEKLMNESPGARAQWALTKKVSDALLATSYKSYFLDIAKLPVTSERTVINVDAAGNERSRTTFLVKGRAAMRIEELRSAQIVANAARNQATSSNGLTDGPQSVRMDDEQPCVGECEGGGVGGGDEPLTNGQRTELLATIAAVYSEWVAIDDSVTQHGLDVDAWWNETDTSYVRAPKSLKNPLSEFKAGAAFDGHGAQSLMTGSPCHSENVQATGAALYMYSVASAAVAVLAAPEVAVGVAVGTVAGVVGNGILVWPTFQAWGDCVTNQINTAINSVYHSLGQWMHQHGR